MDSIATKDNRSDDAREDPRTHLLVMATLYAQSGSAPVRIRNMSPSGALVESPVLPEPGSRVMLKRGSLEASGEIAWRFEGRAGIAFLGAVYVSDWMSRQPGPQHWVDEIVSACRAVDRPPAGLAGLAPGDRATPGAEAELLMLRADLERLGNALVTDPILVATHPEIQFIDISLQRIDGLIARL